MRERERGVRGRESEGCEGERARGVRERERGV